MRVATIWRPLAEPHDVGDFTFMLTISNVGAENFLSFQRLDLRLGPFNALVGPNGAGKSNLLQIFQFLGDVARLDLIDALRHFGGFDSIRFRGAGSKSGAVRLSLRGQITKYSSVAAPDEYRLTFWPHSYRTGERADTFRRLIQRNETIVLKRTAGQGRRITLSGNTLTIGDDAARRAGNGKGQLDVRSSSTGLATIRRLGQQYEASQVEELAQIFLQLRLFEIDVEAARQPSLSLADESLNEDASNLASFLNWLRLTHLQIFQRLCADVSQVLPSFESFEFTELGGAGEAAIIYFT